ncbi:MAG: pyridoxal phosphate-dependent aminotransferase [Desulfobacterales bacterium]|nr:MAG: pyridoxal phosphate-dependent aminotransferase [Desulfobacterales bacterium]
MRLADRVQQIEASRTNQMTPLIAKLRREGRSIINLAVGEPEDDTPGGIIDATKAALDARQTRYGPVPGLSDLRAAIAGRYEGYDQDNIVISNGSKQSLFSIFQVICNPGDEVIIPRPYWVSFPEQVKLAGGTPVLVDTRDHQLDGVAIENAISPKTRALLINSPNNPTGAVYPRSDLEQIVRLAVKYDLYLVSDEAYRLFVYDGLRYESLFQFEQARERLILTASFSKSYSMTGFRVGYTAATPAISHAIAKFQSHVSGNVCTFAQHGALAALGQAEKDVADQRSNLEKKRNLAYHYAAQVFDCIKPQGAFYLFPDVSKHLSRGESADDFAAYLLANAGVAVVSGEAFGMPGHIRLSYAVAEESLRMGLEKILGVL